ncbi:hypothetical protein D3C87_1403250 [compost metagenome]
MLYFPFLSVRAFDLLTTALIATPGNGVPLSLSFTIPVIVLPETGLNAANNNNTNAGNNSCFIVVCFLVMMSALQKFHTSVKKYFYTWAAFAGLQLTIYHTYVLNVH